LMNQISNINSESPIITPNEVREIRAVFVDLDRSLGQLNGSADQVFLEIGNVLGHAVDVFGRLSRNLAELSQQLHSPEAHSAVESLEQAVQGISRLSGTENQTGPILIELDGGAAEISARLSVLRRITSEVSALAINGKIQAALVSATDVDFSVFTTEIGRLGEMAGKSIDLAATRLAGVCEAVASARNAADDFERNEARELFAVRARIESSLGVLMERRVRAAKAADSMAAKSRLIAQRIAATVSRLQINDSVSQRLEHIRAALKDILVIAAAEPPPSPELKWLGEIAGERRHPMIGGMYQLQALQLSGGASDYHKEVEGLMHNLSALAVDAAEILTESEGAFGGGSGGGLFVAEIEQDISRVTELLAAYDIARERTASVVDAVSQGFVAMYDDLASIQSIDADMRVMGLNATFKCGRLGDAGRALGVVAHELRACSRRTEDCSHGIAALLESVLALSNSLTAASSGDNKDAASKTINIMADSIAALSGLGRAMSSNLEELRADAGQTSVALTKACAEIHIHHQLEKLAHDGCRRLIDLAGQFAPGTDLDDGIQQDIHRLMQPYYTMDSERIIHQTFAKDSSFVVPVAEVSGAENDGDIDDLFF
jgi:hypothetical protein